MPLTNDLSNLASEANAIYNSITANSTAITSLTVAGQTINSSGFAVNATFTNTFTIGTSTYFVSNGNVGIGTSTPANRLQISGYSSANQLSDIYISRSSSGTTIQTGPNITFADNVANNTTAIQTTQGRFGIWNYGGGVWNERVSIASSGEVGIGTTSPSFRLDINGNVIGIGTTVANPGAGGNIRYRDDTGTVRWLSGLLGTSGERSFSIYDAVSGVSRATFASNGNIGFGTVTPVYDFHLAKTGGSITNLVVQNSGTGTNTAYVASVANGYASYIQQYSSGEAYFYTGGSQLLIGTASSSPLILYTNNLEKMRINSAGQITTPYQPAFWAYGSGTQSWSGAQVYTKVNFSAGGQYANINKSSGWSQSNSRFTAPVAGTYEFVLSFATSAGGGSTGPAALLYKNGAAFQEVCIGYFSTTYCQCTGNVFLELAVNDYVEFFMSNYNATTFSIDLGRTHFSGRLIG